ncbi:hypothetical protein HELRODRAFT_143678, partial [Helobdella robusta]|uniref:Rab-GAP TBC domain-containing protein n=1 Tax=Helobdella robusta TaxID=6412 RepID=T1EJB7_HELRO
RDVSRTFPKHKLFADEGGQGQTRLFNVMKAYSLYDQEVGYCQGMAFVVALILTQMPEEEAFAVFVQMMGKYKLRRMYIPGMSGVDLSLFQLENMIQDLNPRLHKHFQMHGMFASMYASSWFLSLFTITFSPSLASRVVDLFLVEGLDVILALCYSMLDVCSYELLTRDLEGMI